MTFKDETGNRYGRLEVLSYHSRSEGKAQHPRFLCKCDCGNVVIVTGTNLRQEHTKSCGCLNREVAKDLSTTHGKSDTKTHKSWTSMIERCYAERLVDNEFYQKKGISVCDRWLESFENFYTDMGERPEGMTLDRIDPNGNYEPSNCRWADLTVQGFNCSKYKNNTSGRTGVYVLANGKYGARIGYKGKNICLGKNLSYEEACSLRSSAEIKYYGWIKE